MKAIVQKTRSFFSEVRAELQKVTWPTREELRDSTAVVLTAMAILSLFIGVADFFFSNVISVILR